MRLNSLYECSCPKCRAERLNGNRHIHLASSSGNTFKDVLKAAERALKYLTSQGGYKAEDISRPEYQKLIDETYKVFDSAIRDNDIPEEMMRALQSDAFLFGSLKTHAQLLEADSLLTKDGRVKSYRELDDEFRKLNVEYNQNYLEAEYQFAVNSSQMAAKWAELDEDGRYNLQYRTASDDRVRPEHAELEGITLPKDDAFWLEYYPPNGWNCRCTVVEVRKSKFPESDPEEALEKGEAATTQIGKDGKNRAAIFRFNPGKEEKLFPPAHPYGKVKGADEVKEKLLPKLTPEKIGDYEKRLQSQYGKSWTIEQTYPEKDGYIVVQNGHGKEEKGQNVLSFTPLAKNGKKVELVRQETVMIDGIKQKIKTHDAIIVNNSEKWEAKTTKNYKSLKNISDKAVTAQTQGAEIMLIDIYRNNNFNVDDLVKGIGFSFEKSTLAGICVMIESNRYETINRKMFNNGTYKDIIKKMVQY